MVDNINVGPCLTLAELATQVNEALDGAVGSSPTFAVELLSTPVIPYGDPPTLTIEDNTGGSPPTDYKIVFNFPQQGSGGDQGDPGATPVFTRPVLVDVLAAGVDPYVTMSEPTGDPPAYQLTFGVAPGADGVTGTAGKTPTFVAGTATDLSYGSSPTVSLPLTVGSDPPKYTLNVGIPRGPAGGSSGDSSLRPAVVVRLTVNNGSRGKLLGAYHSDSTDLRPSAIGTTIDLENTLGLAKSTLSGQVWLAAWSIDATEYQLLHELTPLSVIRGTAKASFGTTTAVFAVDNLEIVSGRLPNNSSGSLLSEVTVTNKQLSGSLVVRPGASGLINDIVYLQYDEQVGDDESDRWVPIPAPFFSLVKGQVATDITPTLNPTFNISAIQVVRGRYPGTSLQITNNPPCYFSASDWVYASYNPTAGQSWDTADSHNFIPILKGIGGWSSATNQSIGHDTPTTTVLWQDDAPCDG